MFRVGKLARPPARRRRRAPLEGAPPGEHRLAPSRGQERKPGSHTYGLVQTLLSVRSRLESSFSAVPNPMFATRCSVFAGCFESSLSDSTCMSLQIEKEGRNERSNEKGKIEVVGIQSLPRYAVVAQSAAAAAAAAKRWVALQLAAQLLAGADVCNTSSKPTWSCVGLSRSELCASSHCWRFHFHTRRTLK